MKRRASRDDFEYTKPLVAGEQAFAGKWLVREDDGYEIEEVPDKAQHNSSGDLSSDARAQSIKEISPNSANLYEHRIFPEEFADRYFERGYLFRYLRARRTLSTRPVRWKRYNPAKKVPGLFLSFAQLYNSEQNYSDEPILRWVNEYGLLGVDGFSGEQGGGYSHSLAEFVWQIYWAAGLLRMYEAVLNRDEESAKQALLKDFVYVQPEYSGTDRQLGPPLRQSVHLRPKHPDIDSKEDKIEDKQETIDFIYNEDYIKFALDTVASCTHEKVQRNCYPTLHIDQKDPLRVEMDFGYKNLLGAMYLQFYWLITSNKGVPRCQYCSRIITPLHSKGRKRRNDSVHCSSACRQAAYRERQRSS